MWVFALILAIPLIEIALFIMVGGWLTLWPTWRPFPVSSQMRDMMILAQKFAGFPGKARA